MYILSVKKHNFTLGFCSHTHVSISVLRFLVTKSLTTEHFLMKTTIIDKKIVKACSIFTQNRSLTLIQ